MILWLMIALGSQSFAQCACDSLVCFTVTEAREINEKVTLFPVVIDDLENKKQRIWWGVGGVLAGAVTYAILQ